MKFQIPCMQSSNILYHVLQRGKLIFYDPYVSIKYPVILFHIIIYMQHNLYTYNTIIEGKFITTNMSFIFI